MNAISAQLREFIFEAKKNAYASEKPGFLKMPVLESSKEIQFTKGSFLYRDIYFGTEQFSGIEVAYDEDTPVWSMVYGGGILSPADAKEVYAFLRRALRNVSWDFPTRGPRIFREGYFAYENNLKGSLERFTGEENIFIDGEEVYRLNYQGGVIA